MDYVDVLVVTALREERCVIDRAFVAAFRDRFKLGVVEHDTNVPLIIRDGPNAAGQERSGEIVHVSLPGQNALRVAWTNLTGVGNVWAYDETSELIDLLSPRFVLLVGLAGGSSDVFARGDVGYSTRIGNSSYGKIESENIEATIRRLAEDKSSSEELADVAIQALTNLGMDMPTTDITSIEIRPSEMIDLPSTFTAAVDRSADEAWQMLAQQWCEKYRSDFQLLYGKNTKENYPEQSACEKTTPSCHEAVVASGEAVVASAGVQRSAAKVILVDNRRQKVHIEASMYEMESYGVGLCCRRRNTGFGMIKGISDLAGGDKKAGSEEGNRFRLAAIASASALAFEVICDDGFLRSMAPREDRYGWSHGACIGSNPETARRCLVPFKVMDEKGRFLQARPCNSPREVRHGQEVVGSRLIEGVTSAMYSECVQRIVKADFERLVLVFPYSIEDLLAFFYGMPNEFRRTVIKMRTVIHKKRGGKNNNHRRAAILKAQAIQLGKLAYNAHPHFGATNVACAKWIREGQTFGQIAKKVCRVMCIQDKDLSDLRSNPAFLLHVFMCGLCVPTFLARQTTIDRYGADEATFVSVLADELTEPSKVVTKCLKYSDRGRTLSVIGSCEQLPDGCRRSSAHDFAEEVTRHVQGLSGRLPARGGGTFEIFPALGLLDHHGVKWSDEQTLVPDAAVGGEKVHAYLSALSRAEKRIS